LYASTRIRSEKHHEPYRLACFFHCCRLHVDGDNRQVTEIEIDASIDNVWKAFSTTEGLKSWAAPLAAAAKQTWTVFYFTPVTESRTRVRVVGLGYTESEQSQQLRAFFEEGNKHSLKQLAQALTKKQVEKQK